MGQVRCPCCGWSGESEELQEKDEKEIETLQSGFYTTGLPLKAVSFRDLECPRCGTKLGEVEFLAGIEIGRTDVSSEEAKDVRCEKCGWEGKDVQLDRAEGETGPSDAAHRSTYREQGVGEVKSLCPKCGNVIDSKAEPCGRAID